MRVKNDTCIKSYQLYNTMFLTNEEFGVLMRKIMIEDDSVKSRYDTDEEIKNAYKEYEDEWLRDFDKMKKQNQMLMQAYMILRGQTKKSREAFDKLQDVLENKQKSKEQTAEVPAEGKTAPLEVPTSEKIEKAEDKKGSFWLFGSDCEVENDEAAIRDEITADEWINDPNLTFDYQSGSIFKWIIKAKLSRNMTACEVIREYLKSEYDYEKGTVA